VTGQEVTRHKLGIGKFQIVLKGRNLTTRLVKGWNEYPEALQDFHPQTQSKLSLLKPGVA